MREPKQRQWMAQLPLLLAMAALLAATGNQAHGAQAPAAATDVPADPRLLQIYADWRAGRMDQVTAALRPMASGGNSAAEFLLGSLYSTGQGVTEDDEVAVQWWRKAAEQGLARAQNELGVALEDGRGVKADAHAALDWFRRAAGQGLAVAQVNLGLMYLNGLGGLHRDDAQAATWFRKAADQGMGWAQYYLGIAYSEGRGVRQDGTQAYQWLRKAASQDYMDAELQLGLLFARGQGVARSKGQAAYWFARAAQAGQQDAVKILRDSVANLSQIRLPGATPVREQADPTSAVLRNTEDDEFAYVLDRSRQWTRVYLEKGYTVGYVDSSAAQTR